MDERRRRKLIEGKRHLYEWNEQQSTQSSSSSSSTTFSQSSTTITAAPQKSSVTVVRLDDDDDDENEIYQLRTQCSQQQKQNHKHKKGINKRKRLNPPVRLPWPAGGAVVGGIGENNYEMQTQHEEEKKSSFPPSPPAAVKQTMEEEDPFASIDDSFFMSSSFGSAIMSSSSYSPDKTTRRSTQQQQTKNIFDKKATKEDFGRGKSSNNMMTKARQRRKDMLLQQYHDRKQSGYNKKNDYFLRYDKNDDSSDDDFMDRHEKVTTNSSSLKREERDKYDSSDDYVMIIEPTPPTTNKNKNDKRNPKRRYKPQKTFHRHPSSHPSLTASQKQLWVDKYKPANTATLCVAPKKIKEVKDWMMDCLSSLQQQQTGIVGTSGVLDYNCTPNSNNNMCKLLILVGSPGIGKSTMIRVLASELNVNILEWNDANYQNGRNGGRTTTTTNFRQANSDGDGFAMSSLPYQSQLSSFEDFILSAGIGFSALDVVGEEQEQKQKSCVKSDNGSLVLIEEIPNLHTAEAAEKFRNIMARHIQQSTFPTVIIHSDVCEGKHKPEDLERLIDPTYLYSPVVRIMQIHPVTKAKMKKCLEQIAKQEQIRSFSPSFCEEIHMTSGGDLRHAIMALQFQIGSLKGSSGRLRRFETGHGSGERDTKLSTFHALGKLLYAKRKKVGSYAAAIHAGRETSSLFSHALTSTWGSTNDESKAKGKGVWVDSRPPLDFVPEKVMNESDIDRGGALSFLSYHSPDFFTDETELSKAFDLFSDAAVFLGRTFDTQRDHGDSVFPLEYVSSLAGRAIADANKHPAPHRFRALGAPKVFEVMRKKRGNDVKMQQLCKRLSFGSDELPVESMIGSSGHFVTDRLPFLRSIIPDEVDYSLSNLYSHARQETENNVRVDQTADPVQASLKEQQSILEMDDIVDDESLPDKDGKIEHADRTHTPDPEVIIID